MSQSETKICQNCKSSFVVDATDFAFYAKIKVPSPTFCPECRTIRRMMFRNERTLYKRECNAPGHNEEIISIYHKDSPFKVYDQQYWWSDNWDPMEYGRDYDFNKPFFEQWAELRNVFPLMGVSNSRAVNSEYCNVNDKSKDCYLISASYENERVMYSNRVVFSKDCLDLYIANKNELCYENIFCRDSYRLFFSHNSENCIESAFLYNCRNCSNCFGCANLRNKSYYFLNQSYTKKEYLNKIKDFDFGNYSSIKNAADLFAKIYQRSIHRYAEILSSVNAIGDNLLEVKNCLYCFDIQQAEDCKFVNWGGFNLKDSYDSGPGIGDVAELLYETFGELKNSRVFFAGVVYESRDIQYSFNCYNSKNLFGCIGLRNKQYCILNKQYSKEEYEALVPKIIEHMNSMPYINKKGRVYKYGEFFPPELSPFCYNETIAREYFPLSAEAAAKAGYNWKQPEPRNYQIDIKSVDLPDHIRDAPDSIVGKVIQCQHAVSQTNADATQTNADSPHESVSNPHKSVSCNEQCTEAFKIIEPELQFYKRMNLPLPRLCPNCRHYQRLKQRNPLKLWKRQCMCQGTNSQPTTNNLQQQNYQYKNTIKHQHGDQPCHNEFETTYAPNRPEIVYCEKCYLAEVV